MENTLGLKEGGIVLGPWGCLGSSQWCCLPESGIREVIIHHGRAISTIKFTDGDEYEYDDDGGRDGDDYKYKIDKNPTMKAIEPREAGPWGGRGGKPWDDGVFSAIKQVYVHVENGIVRAILLQYDKRGGVSVWSESRGRPSNGSKPNKVILAVGEILVGIAGFYGEIEGNDGLEVLRSITFYSSKGVYGPYGDEIGTYFRSAVYSGKVVAFHGSSGLTIDAIGVHMRYF